MDRDRFYELIDAARDGVEDVEPGADPDELRVVLDRLDDDDLTGFAAVFRDELVRLNDRSVRAAGSVAAGAMSDEGFHAFRCWLVGKGAAAVSTAVTAPDELDVLLEEDPELGNDAIESVVFDLLDERGLPDPRLDDDAAPVDGDPRGEPVAQDDVPARFPRITAWVAARS